MWSRRSAIERCPSPWNRIRKCPTVTDNGLVKGTDILLKQILCSNIGKSLNIIALHWPVICYCWAFTYSVSRRRASLDRRSTTPHVLDIMTLNTIILFIILISWFLGIVESYFCKITQLQSTPSRVGRVDVNRPTLSTWVDSNSIDRPPALVPLKS